MSGGVGRGWGIYDSFAKPKQAKTENPCLEFWDIVGMFAVFLHWLPKFPMPRDRGRGTWKSSNSRIECISLFTSPDN